VPVVVVSVVVVDPVVECREGMSVLLSIMVVKPAVSERAASVAPPAGSHGGADEPVAGKSEKPAGPLERRSFLVCAGAFGLLHTLSHQAPATGSAL
jgi:hypothetical protein